MRKGHSLWVLLIAVFGVIFVPSIQAAPSPPYAWHTFYGASLSEEPRSIATDGSGNVYITGDSSVTWNGPAGQPPLHAHSGGYDIFVLKLDSNGAYQWHTFYGASDYDLGYGIATDGSGNIYATGESGAAWNGPAGESPLHAYTGNMDNFVLKLDSNGAYQWHTFYGASDRDDPRGIVTDGSGNVYVTGYSTATWNGPAGESPLGAFRAVHEDIFVLKLDSSGAYQWHTFSGAPNGTDNAALGIAPDGSGNVYVTGYSTATWNGPAGESPLHAYTGGVADMFVLKLNSSGAYQWHTFYGSSSEDQALGGIATDGIGHVYVTGISNTTWNGPAEESPLHAHSGGSDWDIFALKLDSSGTYQWHTFYGSSNADWAYGTATDGIGNLYITGYSGATWNGPAGQSPVHPYIGSDDIFVLKLASSGSYQWHIFYGSSTYDHGYAIATDGSGNTYVTGASWGTWNGPAGESPLHPYSQYYGDIFVLKLVAQDLIETAVSDPPSSPTAGSSFSVTDTVKNQGSASVGASITSYYLSLDTTKDIGDILLTGSRSVPSLGINETNDGILTVTIPLSTASGSYYLLACADDTNVVGEDNENNNCIASVSKANVTAPVIPTEITLQSPVEGTVFDSCSLIATHRPTFKWTSSGALTGYFIQFSISPSDFKTRGVLISSIRIRGTSVSWTPTVVLWKAIRRASNNSGNIRDIYWRVVGIMPNKTTVESEVRSFRIGPPQPVTVNSPDEGVTLPFSPPPSFDITTNCNVKFRLEFSPSDAFSDPKSIRGFVFTLKDPALQPTFQKTLTFGQWIVVKRLLAPRGYFRIRAWDAMGRESISGARSFNIQSMLIGNWDVTGRGTTTVALVGYRPVTRRAAALDAFTFSEDGSFQMIDLSGTYTEQGATFRVNLSPAVVELYFEQSLGASLGTQVDVSVTGVYLGGSENWRTGAIGGTMTMSMGISIPSQSLQGTVKATVTFRGIRSSLQGLSLSTLEVSSLQPSQSSIRMIGADINNSIQTVKGGGQ